MRETRNLKKAGVKLMIVLLTVALVLPIMPITAYAADTEVSDEAGLRAAVAAGSGTIILMNNITLTAPLVITRSCDITIQSGKPSDISDISSVDYIYAPSSRHILLSDNITVNLTIDRIQLDGMGTGGGIAVGALQNGAYDRISGVNLSVTGVGDACFFRCFSEDNGAAVSVVGLNNSVTLTGLQFYHNKLAGTGSISRAGGAVYMDGTPLWLWESYTGSLLIDNCTFYSNDAGAMSTGGAVAGVGIQTTIQDSGFDGNAAENAGGAVFFSAVNTGTASTLLIQGGTMKRNHASMGGAIAVNLLDKLEVRGTAVFSGNTADEGRLMTDPADISTHSAQIDGTMTASQDFIYLYNNCDVLYLDGTPMPVEQPSGVSVTGQVRSYNPSNPVALKLMRGDVEEYSAFIASLSEYSQSGYDRYIQSFAFENVEPGMYSLVITKPGHTSFTVQTVIVGNEDLDLTQDSRPAVQCMNLLCGDINGDEYINDSDLAILWQAANYNKAANQAANRLCDLNGDGYVNDSDLAILWQAVNYNKGAVTVP